MVNGGQLCTRCSWRVTEAGYGLVVLVPDKQQSLKSEPSQRQEVLVTDVVTERVLVASMAPVCLVEVCCGHCLLRAGSFGF